jgi:hypothetical protein
MGGVFGRALDALLAVRAVKKVVDQMLEKMKRQSVGQTMFTGYPVLPGSRHLAKAIRVRTCSTALQFGGEVEESVVRSGNSGA